MHSKKYTIRNSSPLPQLIWSFLDSFFILKPGHPSSSTNVEDYEFGLHDSEISRYVYHANMFHALMIFRYGCKEVTPYMMKFVDVVPKHLCSTPFKSLMRDQHQHLQMTTSIDKCRV